MATLPTRSFPTIVSTIAAGMQGRVNKFLNFAFGSVLRAIAEAVAGNSLWLQGMLLEQVKLTRLSTSYGEDADSWVADWNIITRLGPVAATGLCVFSRHTAGGAAPLIPVGSKVQTLDGKQQFEVYADTTNPSYSVTRAGYVMPAQIANLAVPVVSITPSPSDASGKPGANGNVTAGAIARLASSVPGVDTVTNVAAFTNGSDGETDEAFKDRFRDAVQAMSRGTPPAIRFAIQSIQSGLQVIVLDGKDYSLLVDNGMTSVIVDDGTGSIGNVLLQKALVAADGYRAAGTRIGVFAALVTYANVQMVLTVKRGYARQIVVAQIVAEVARQINGRGLGAELDYLTVGSWALAIPGVQKIDNLTVNGTTADILGDPRYTIKCSGVVVN